MQLHTLEDYWTLLPLQHALVLQESKGNLGLGREVEKNQLTQ